MNDEKFLKMKEKIKGLIALGESEAKIGNTGAAATIAEKVQSLMQKFHFDQDEFQKAHPEIPYQPLIGVSVVENIFLSKRPIEIRKPWAEYLASVVSSGYYCRVLVNSRSGKLSFFGIDFDRDIAVMMFEKIASMAFDSCKNEMEKAKKMVGKKAFDPIQKKAIVYPKVWMGSDVFTESFMFGFGEKLNENYLKNSDEDSLKRVDQFVLSQPDYHLQKIKFDPWTKNQDVIDLGRKYGNFTAKKKTDGLVKSANVEIAKSQKQEIAARDNRIGEVILVIDDSGSMSGQKCRLAANGAKDFALDAINKKFAVGLIKFGSESYLLSNPKLELNGEFDSALNQIYGNSGGTAMYSALKLAAESFSKFPQKRVIVLATDGQPTDGAQASITYANMLKASGIKILTIGTNDADQEFLKQIASDQADVLQVSDGELRKALKGMAGLLPA